MPSVFNQQFKVNKKKYAYFLSFNAIQLFGDGFMRCAYKEENEM